MAAIDYETEYNARAAVPDHLQIFARWTRDAEDYRVEALKRGRAELGLSYGDTQRQFIDLFLSEAGESAPLALFIHGGYWRAQDPSSYSHLARGLNGRGITVAVVGYDLCPVVRIADIIGEMQRACAFLWQRFSRRLLVCGHSAGGHLTAAMVATDWQSLYPKAPADLVPAGYAISGLFDLAPLRETALNQDLRLDAEEAQRVSPQFWPVAPRRSLDAVVGGLESSEFKRQSRTVADAWRQAGAETRYEEIGGANHFTILEPLTDPTSAMVARLAALAQQASR